MPQKLRMRRECSAIPFIDLPQVYFQDMVNDEPECVHLRISHDTQAIHSFVVKMLSFAKKTLFPNEI